jgi:hypothetical protein
MSVRVGSAIFDDHISIELVSNKWTDTFILPVYHDMALPPWDLAEAVKTVIPVLRKLRRGASVWVPVIAPGSWYFDEVKYVLRDASLPVAVTRGRDRPPGILDFSRPPAIYDAPCRGGVPVDRSPAANLSEKALHSLLVMARLTAAYTNEVASSCMLEDRACRKALWELEKQGYVEYHKGDTQIDSHLSTVRQTSNKGKKKDGDIWPYWRIRRPGLSASLRAWGIPAGSVFGYRSEKNRLLDSIHRRRSRQWPKWVSKALSHANIYAGWSEVGVPGLKANPDALAWGILEGFETLFWLEVESGHSSRNLILGKTTDRWLKATGYAEAVGVHLVFVFLAMPWVRHAARLAFMDVPETCAVIIADWSRRHFGQLPFPKWGEAVVEQK